jgi:hypothetical protein
VTHRRCAYCDQALPQIRVGVRLPELKARIFDLVRRGGTLRLAIEIARVAENSRLMTAPPGAQPGLIGRTSSNQENSHVE